MADEGTPGSSLPKIFDADPALKAKIEAYLRTIPDEQKQADLEKVEKFVSGELTWAEIKGYPKSLLKGLAEVAYSRYRAGDFKTAESLFKGLSIIDHSNWYYRSALGAIYQKQKIYEQALEEYTVALSLNENEISTLTNRAECYLKLGDLRPALKDLKRVIALDPKGVNAWVKRAKVLLKHLEGRAKKTKG